MRVGLLTQWYDPEPGPGALPSVLARGLVERGHEVHVLTGFPNYPMGVIAPGYAMKRSMDETRAGVSVRRVALYPNHDASAIRRVVNYASFGASAVANGLGSLRGLDALWVNYSPITVAWPMWAARYGLRIPQVAHIFDLWPDTLTLSGFAKAGRAYRMAEPVLSTWCRAMYSASEAIAYISPGVGQILQSRGVPEDKLHYVPIWADEAVFHPSEPDLRAELGIPPDAIVLLYAGALGEAQGLITLIDACAQITDNRFLCLIAGSGNDESNLRAHADARGTINVRFLGRLPQEQMTALMATGDFNYVGLRPHALSAVTMPSKTQAGLAAGRALLVAADGDITAVVRDSCAGFIADPRDPSTIAAAIRTACDLGRVGLHEMGKRARQYYERTFSVDRGVSSIELLLEKAAGTRRRT
jgi:colanic acid biosynthesis glycosyl transferase WcaI